MKIYLLSDTFLREVRKSMVERRQNAAEARILRLPTRILVIEVVKMYFPIADSIANQKKHFLTAPIKSFL